MMLACNCTPASCWALPAWSARAAPSSCACCLAPTGPTGAASRCTRKIGPYRRPSRLRQLRHLRHLRRPRHLRRTTVGPRLSPCRKWPLPRNPRPAPKRPGFFPPPRKALAAGRGLATEARKPRGLLLPQPIRINATLSDLGAIARGGWLQRALENRLVQSLVHRLGIRCRNAEQPVGQLSGGNQQKVVFARWLHRPCRV